MEKPSGIQKLKAMGMLAGASAAILAASFASCSSGNKNKSESPKPEIIIPTSPGTETPNESLNPLPPAPPTLQTGIDGTWYFSGFECTQGTLTPWAKLENELVSPTGLETGVFTWNTGGTDDGHVKRKHIWKISGETATRESVLEFYSTTDSLSAQDLRATLEPKSPALSPTASPVAWAATTKHYKLSKLSDGRLQITHGEIEGPFFKGLPLDPVHKVIQNQLGSQTEKGVHGPALLGAIQNIQKFLQRTFTGQWVGSIMDFVNEVTQATETLNYTFDQTTMTFSNARVSIQGFTGEPGVKLVDVSACGLGGQAVRKYQRDVTPIKK